MFASCGCNWNLGRECYLHSMDRRVSIMERNPDHDPAYLARLRAELAAQQALFDKARAEGEV